MRSHLAFPVLAVGLIVAGCGSQSARQTAERLSTSTPTLVPGHLEKVPIDRSKKATPFPTLKPGVPTPILATAVPRTPKPYVWPASAYTAHIHGTITNSRTHAPISGAKVSLAGGQRTALSGSNGRYSMAFPVGGSVTVEVSRKGYIAQPGVGMLTTGQSTKVDFSLEPVADKGKAPPSFPVIIGKPH